MSGPLLERCPDFIICMCIHTVGNYGDHGLTCHYSHVIVSPDSPRLSHSLEDFAAIIPHDHPHQLPIMEVCLLFVIMYRSMYA